ncbi:MAG TPA: hypothetical protein PKA91_10055, partial [Leptospiraceae bacterium]|nr:hypothetical protein [Leptospiraceae bacterium]
MPRFEPFPFTADIADNFRAKKQIPAHLYSKEGQILIYRKDGATDGEIDKILKFAERGIYYNVDDAESLGLKGDRRDVPAGLSDTKLFASEKAQDLTRETQEIFSQLRETAITSDTARKTKATMTQVFDDFESQPDAMIGLVNIIECMKDAVGAYDVQMAVKRTVVSMAMKTRGMHANSFRERQKMQEMATVVMTSALFCDIGTTRMKMPTDVGLTPEQMSYVRNHPLMSYLLIAHQDEIDSAVKRNILCHHRPLRQGLPGNNYPELKPLILKLGQLLENYEKEPSRQSIVRDLKQQIHSLKQDIPYDEDANILAIASEFASLTSRTSWREAHTPQRAVRSIINNSYFTYAERAIREFLDHVAISLCDNKKIISEGDFIVLVNRSAEGKTFFEVCQITSSSRYQSRPGVDRVAEILPIVDQSPKLKLTGFDISSIRPDKRFAHYELAQDDSRRL